jgi:RHS repeat-associated protein
VFGLVGNEATNGTEQSYVPSLSMTLATSATLTSLSTPAVTGSTVATRTPTLVANSIADDSGTGAAYLGVAEYRFEISTGSGAGNGVVVSSDWQPDNHWRVPDHTLRDGATYYARVATSYQTLVGYGTDPQPPNATADRQFKVALNLGSGGPSPTDTAGSVSGVTGTPSQGSPSPSTPGAAATVNLVDGNLAVGVGTHQVQAVAGAIAPNLVFNSKGDTNAGLVATYTNDDGDGTIEPGEVTKGVRVDPTVNFTWSGVSPPVAAMPPTSGYIVEWSGVVQLPGTWTLGVTETGAGGARVKIDSTTIADEWNAPSSVPVTKLASSTTNTSPHQITVDYHTGQFGGSVQLFAVDGSGVTHVADPSWFTQTAASLPDHWQLNTGAASATWIGLQDLGAQVDVRGADGSSAAFTRTSGGGFLSPPGSTDLLTQDDTGTFQLNSASGLLYTFRPDGQLVQVVSSSDDLHPAALTYTYNTTGQLTTITDPVSSRSVTFNYSGGSPTGPCAISGAAAPPSSMVWRIDFWDHVSTYLCYDASHRLIRVATPGFSAGSSTGYTITDLGYDSTGQLTALRDPLVDDYLAYGFTPSASQETDFTFDTCSSSNPTACGRVLTVTKPALGANPRTQATYAYDTATPAAWTTVNMASFTPASGYARKVFYDGEGRITQDIDSVGHITGYVWDAQSRVVAATTPSGLETGTTYDFAGNKTDTWGPAPTADFDSNGQPLPAYVSTIPHATTAYDDPSLVGGGLGATWWANNQLAGTPYAHSLGTGASGGVTYFGDGIPSQLTGSSASTGNWSVRLNGLITFPTTYGGYRLKVLSLGGVRVYLDDTLIIDSWTDPVTPPTPDLISWPPLTSPAASFNAGEQHRLRIDYRETQGQSTFDLKWHTSISGSSDPEIPSFSTSTGGLSPNYGLATNATDADGKITDTSYIDAPHGIYPQYGLPTATTQDPGGLHPLTTRTTYEDPAVTGTYLRVASKTLPAGATTTSCYWGTNCGGDSGITPPTAWSNPCGTAGINQGGQIKQKSGPLFGTDNHQVEQYVYDDAGHPVGIRKGTDGTGGTISSAGWACTLYDQRGRITMQTWPTHGSISGRVVQYNYAVANDPLTTSVTDPGLATGDQTISTHWDLNGHLLRYTARTQTDYMYDRLGRLVNMALSPTPEAAIYSYDPNSGQLSSAGYNDGDDDHTLATPNYDSSGRLSSVSYANGTTLALTYNPFFGQLTERKYTHGSTVLYDETNTFSAAGRVKDQSVSNGSGLTDANPSGDNFYYDGAGRLTLSYTSSGMEVDSYDTASCGATNAGLDTNRTSITRGSTTQTLCYDAADRLTSTNGSSTNVTYDDHGNTLTTDTQTYTYDAADRLASTHAGSTTDTYIRDPVNRILTGTGNRLAYTGYGDAPGEILNSTGSTVNQYYLPLPGGITYHRALIGSTTTYQYPNLHGDTALVADSGGNQVGTDATYTPWGEGTPPSTGGTTLGYLGTKGKITDNTAGITPIIDMGARPYRPDLGRFLAIDPVEGGCANSYAYGYGDPVNATDSTGRSILGDLWDGLKGAAGWVINQVGQHSCGLLQILSVVAAVAALYTGGSAWAALSALAAIGAPLSVGNRGAAFRVTAQTITFAVAGKILSGIQELGSQAGAEFGPQITRAAGGLATATETVFTLQSTTHSNCD